MTAPLRSRRSTGGIGQGSCLGRCWRLSGRARTELIAAGGDPRRLVLSGPGALTPSEGRVAQLAATGLSGHDIAQTVFVTARTAEGHLTQCLPKLAIASWGQLPAARTPLAAGSGDRNR
jgi:DNA-binding NarL/FixJ family response regulator